jgi:hypothetical protein
VPTYAGTTVGPPVNCGVQFDYQYDLNDPDSDSVADIDAEVSSGTCTYLNTLPYGNWFSVIVRAPASGLSDCVVRARASDGRVWSGWVSSSPIAACHN